MNLRSLTPSHATGTVARPEVHVFGSLHREVDRLFEEFSRGFGIHGAPVTTNLVPNINISETD